MMPIFTQRFAWIFAILLLPVGLPRALHADEAMETAGDVLQIALPAAAYAMTFSNDDREGRLQYTQTFLTTMAATYALKPTVDRERPDGGDMSFPSGHTSAAFSGAAFMQMRYGWRYGGLAYAGAAFVGWSRVAADRHYMEDVVAGAGIGLASAAIFTKPYLDKIRVLPFVSQEQIGMCVAMAW